MENEADKINRQLPKEYCQIEWQPDAVEYSVAYSFLKDIVHYRVRNGKVHFAWRQNYTEHDEAELKKKGIVVIDRTAGQTIPSDAALKPVTQLPLGTLQIRRRI